MRLIDADALNFEKCTLETDSSISFYMIDKDDVDNAPTVLEIPDNPTNSDMMRKVFGNVAYFVIKDKMEFENGFMDWWNAPYKRAEDE